MEYLSKAWESIPDRYRPWVRRLIWMVALALYGAVCRWVGVQPAELPAPPLENDVANVVNVDDEPADVAQMIASTNRRVYYTGWRRDDQAVKAVVAGLRFPRFAQTRAGQVREDQLPKAAYLWKAYEKLPVSRPTMRDQGDAGTCVGQGGASAIERTMAAWIVQHPEAGREWRELSVEVIYGGSRAVVGKNSIPDRQDGSVGAWMSEFVTTEGVLPRGVYGRWDLSQYSIPLCRQFGGRSGLPTELRPVIRENTVKTTTQVRTWNEAKKALAQGYGIAVCSNRGFRMTRDNRGVSQPFDTWNHCVCLDGYHTDEAGREFGHLDNSWGPDAHQGPVGWGDPNPTGFWADARVIDGMLRQLDSWAFSGADGFPENLADFRIDRRDPDDVRRRLAPRFALAP